MGSWVASYYCQFQSWDYVLLNTPLLTGKRGESIVIGWSRLASQKFASRAYAINSLQSMQNPVAFMFKNQSMSVVVDLSIPALLRYLTPRSTWRAELRVRLWLKAYGFLVESVVAKRRMLALPWSSESLWKEFLEIIDRKKGFERKILRPQKEDGFLVKWRPPSWFLPLIDWHQSSQLDVVKEKHKRYLSLNFLNWTFEAYNLANSKNNFFLKFFSGFTSSIENYFALLSLEFSTTSWFSCEGSHYFWSSRSWVPEKMP